MIDVLDGRARMRLAAGKDVPLFILESSDRELCSRLSDKRSGRRLHPQTFEPVAEFFSIDGVVARKILSKKDLEKIGLGDAPTTAAPAQPEVARESSVARDGTTIFFSGQVWSIRGHSYKIFHDRSGKQYRVRVRS